MEGTERRSGSIGLDAIFQYTGTGVQFFSGMIFYLIIVRMFSTSTVGAIATFLYGTLFRIFFVVLTEDSSLTVGREIMSMAGNREMNIQ